VPPEHTQPLCQGVSTQLFRQSRAVRVTRRNLRWPVSGTCAYPTRPCLLRLRPCSHVSSAAVSMRYTLCAAVLAVCASSISAAPGPYVNVGTAGSCSFEKRVDFQDHELQGKWYGPSGISYESGDQAGSHWDCAEGCVLNSQCSHFTYIFGTCWYKTSDEGRKKSNKNAGWFAFCVVHQCVFVLVVSIWGCPAEKKVKGHMCRALCRVPHTHTCLLGLCSSVARCGVCSHTGYATRNRQQANG
jgi:hypothetical protein